MDRLPVSLLAGAFYPLSALLARRTYRGGEYLPGRDAGGALLVMNHVSHLDPIYDAVFVHRHGRVPRFLAKDSLFGVPVLGTMLRGARQIPVERGSMHAVRSLRKARQALANGDVVVIYPEGTITKDSAGWPMRPLTGVAWLALHALRYGAPVIPVGRLGTEMIFNGYTKEFKPLPRKTVSTIIGLPIDLTSYQGRPLSDPLLQEVTDLIMRRVTELVADIRGEAPPAQPPYQRDAGR